MSESSWREIARHIIATTEGKCRLAGVTDPKAIAKACNDAYPWYEREHHPYKMWCKEMALLRERLGLTPRKKPPTKAEKELAAKRAAYLADRTGK